MDVSQQDRGTFEKKRGGETSQTVSQPEKETGPEAEKHNRDNVIEMKRQRGSKAARHAERQRGTEVEGGRGRAFEPTTRTRIALIIVMAMS